MSASLYTLSSAFAYDVLPTHQPTQAPTEPRNKSSVNSASSDGLMIIGAAAAAGFLILAILGTFMLRACRKKKDENWVDRANDALHNNGVIEIGRMDESEVPETAIAVAGEWVEQGADAEIPVAA